jgi:hypothetical protein
MRLRPGKAKSQAVPETRADVRQTALDVVQELRRKAMAAFDEYEGSLHAPATALSDYVRPLAEKGREVIEHRGEAVEAGRRAGEEALRLGEDLLRRGQEGLSKALESAPVEKALAAVPIEAVQRRRRRRRWPRLLLFLLVPVAALIVVRAFKKRREVEEYWSARQEPIPSTGSWTSPSPDVPPRENIDPSLAGAPIATTTSSAGASPPATTGGNGLASARPTEASRPAGVRERDAEHLVGRDVVDSGGGKLGAVEAVYGRELDGRPEWVAVSTGLLEKKHVFVPLDDASIDEESIRAPYPKALIEAAPEAGDADVIDEAAEMGLYDHYSLRRVLPGTEQERTPGSTALRRLAGEKPQMGSIE